MRSNSVTNALAALLRGEAVRAHVEALRAHFADNGYELDVAWPVDAHELFDALLDRECYASELAASKYVRACAGKRGLYVALHTSLSDDADERFLCSWDDVLASRVADDEVSK